MKTSSCKAKGRRCSAETAEMLLRFAPQLQEGDIRVVPSSVPGEDILMSPAAEAVYPFAIENKNCESLNVWKALAQAETHAAKSKGKLPALVFKRNRSLLYIALKLEDFLALLNRKSP